MIKFTYDMCRHQYILSWNSFELLMMSDSTLKTSINLLIQNVICRQKLLCFALIMYRWYIYNFQVVEYSISIIGYLLAYFLHAGVCPNNKYVFLTFKARYTYNILIEKLDWIHKARYTALAMLLSTPFSSLRSSALLKH